MKDLFKLLTSYPVSLCVDMDVEFLVGVKIQFVLGAKQRPTEQCAEQAVVNNVV